MRDVRIGHDQVVAAHPRHALRLGGRPVDGHIFANLVVVADFEARRLAFVRNILRSETDRAEWEKMIVGADLCWAAHCDVRESVTALANFDIRTDNAVRSDLRGGMNLGFWVDYRRGMNGHCGFVIVIWDRQLGVADFKYKLQI